MSDEKNEMTARELLAWLEDYSKSERERLQKRFNLHPLWTGKDLEDNIRVQYLQELIGELEERIKKYEKERGADEKNL